MSNVKISTLLRFGDTQCSPFRQAPLETSIKTLRPDFRPHSTGYTSCIPHVAHVPAARMSPHTGQVVNDVLNLLMDRRGQQVLLSLYFLMNF